LKSNLSLILGTTSGGCCSIHQKNNHSSTDARVTTSSVHQQSAIRHLAESNSPDSMAQ